MVREQAKFFWDDAWGPQPFTPASPGSGQASAPAQTEASSGDAGAVLTSHPAVDLNTIDNLGISPADWFVSSAPTPSAAQALSFSTAGPSFNLSDFFQADTMQFTPVAGVVTELQAAGAFHDGGAALTGGDGSGSVFQAGDTLAAMPLNLSDYADHGWNIVPSAANEYGVAYLAADGFVWDVAAGEFASDFFLV